MYLMVGFFDLMLEDQIDIYLMVEFFDLMSEDYIGGLNWYVSDGGVI